MRLVMNNNKKNRIIVKKYNNVRNWLIDYTKYYFQLLLEINKQSKYQKYVLMFHEVLESKVNCAQDEYAISIESLMALCVNIRKLGYRCVTPDEFLNSSDKKQILITFDDAYIGVYTRAFPFLKEDGIPFVVFQSVNNLNEEGYLGDFEIKKMLEYKNFYLGSHTYSHIQMKELTDEELCREIVESKEVLQGKFGHEISMMAYPYGALVTLNKKTIKKTREIYDLAFSTIQKGYGPMFSKGMYKYLIPRLNVNEMNKKNILNLLRNDK